MRWWMILLIIFAAFFLIGQVPLGIDVSYDRSLLIKLKIWFFRVTIGKKKQKKESNGKKQSDKAKNTPKKEKKKPEVGDLISYAELAAELLGDLREKIVLELLELHIRFGGDDPAKSAIAYGRAWAVIGMLTALLEQIFKIKKRDIAPRIDADAKKMEFDARVVCTITLAKLLALALHALTAYLKRKEQLKKGD